MTKNSLKIRLLIIVLFTLFVYNAFSAEPTPQVLNLIYRVALKHNLDAQNFVSIAYIESKFDPNAIRVNKNQTIDYGMFQINSVHWTTTCLGLDIFQLQGNAECAARILSSFKHFEIDDPHWIGRYHSKTPSLKKKYFKLVENAKVHLNKVDK